MPLFDYTLNVLSQGGWTMVPILLCAWAGWYFLFSIWMRLIQFSGNRSKDHFLLQQSRNNGSGRPKRKFGHSYAVFHMLTVLHSVKDQGRLVMEARLEEVMRWLSAEMEKGFSTLGVMAAAAPLLGLFGTVSGIINTFRLITVFGTDNPSLLSSGISEALLTTQTGLTVAVPLMLAYVIFINRAEHLETRVESIGRNFIRIHTQHTQQSPQPEKVQ